MVLSSNHIAYFQHNWGAYTQAIRGECFRTIGVRTRKQLGASAFAQSGCVHAVDGGFDKESGRVFLENIGRLPCGVYLGACAHGGR